MLFNHRVIYKDGSGTNDLSRAVNELFGDTAALTYLVATGYLYIGGDLPFTHRYFRLGTTVNAVTATIDEVAIWDGNSWVDAVDVQDGTAVGGKTMARSGIVTWRTDRESSWSREATTEDMTGSGLEALKVYDMYWARIKFSANLTAAIALAYVGHCFSDDAMLRGVFPDLLNSGVMGAHTSGKTDWIDQHVLGSEEVIRFLQRKREIWSPNQLHNWQRFSMASAYKCAEIAYTAFPNDALEEMRKRAERNYLIAINQSVKEVDQNQNGHAEVRERATVAGLQRA